MSAGDSKVSLKLGLLGPPRIERDGQPVSFDTRKAVALAAYLAVTGRAHSREALAALFWPEYEPARAFANLRRTLWALGRGIGKGWLATGGDQVALADRPGLWLDVRQFRRQLAACAAHPHAADAVCPDCQAHLVTAVDLYAGDLLSGFTLPDSPAFDDWQFFEGEALRRELGSALEHLVRCHLAKGDVQAAIPPARRWLALDPLHEPAHRLLMRLYSWAGQPSAAVRQYRECARLLDEELGVAPEQETEDLLETIQARRPLPSPERWPESPPADLAVTGQAAPIPSSLPPPTTTFVGREPELAEIATRLGRPACRLLTLVGPGGIGKTRLAIEAARRAALRPGAMAEWPQGVFFVSLAPIGSGSQVAHAIAAAMGFAFYEGRDRQPEDQLLDYMADRQLILVLDNLEHLLAAGGDTPAVNQELQPCSSCTDLLSDLLARAPGVRILATSRERLNIQGEWVLAIEGMPYPESEAGFPRTADADSASSAVALFIERARMATPGFALADADVRHLIRICRLVEGWPLGIELAAGWTRLLSLHEIAAEIERGLDVLTTSLRDVPGRHRSLRAVCDHSWRLLSRPEQAVYSRLAVFRGGFDRRAAEEVAGASLSLLQSLVDKSLLQRSAAAAGRAAGGSLRFSLHQVLRQYAVERLDEHPEEREDTRDRHAAFYLHFLEQRRHETKGPRQVEALDQIAAEADNVRVAWQRAVDQRRVRELRAACESLFSYYLVRRGFAEGTEAFGNAAAALQSAQRQEEYRSQEDSRALALARGRMLLYQGYLAQYCLPRPEASALLIGGMEILRPLGPTWELALAGLYTVFWHVVDDPLEEEKLLRESMAIFEEAGDRWGVARCLFALAYEPLKTQARLAQSLEESLALSTEIGDYWLMAMCLFGLGEVAHMLGDLEKAKDQYARCLEIRRWIGDQHGTGTALDYSGYVSREMGHYEEARRLHQESLACAREIGDRLGVAGSLDNLGLVARDEGHLDDARSLLEEGLALRRDLATGWEIAISLEHLGGLALLRGDPGAAEPLYAESLAVSQDLLWSQGTALALAGLAQAFAHTGDLARARRHAASALALAGLMENQVLVQEVLLGVARVLERVGETGEAARLLALVACHPATSRWVREQAGARLDALVEAVPPEDVVEARAWAAKASLEAAIESIQALLERD